MFNRRLVVPAAIATSAAAAIAVVALSGCAAVTASQDPAAQQQITDSSAPMAARIVKACAMSGMFKIVGGLVLAAVPLGTLPKAVLDAGVDRVCADPERFAHDAGTLVWIAKNAVKG